MSVTEVHSEAEFFAAVSAPSPNSVVITVVDFFATWCGPCQHVAPQFATLAAAYASPSFQQQMQQQGKNIVVKFLKVDVDKVQGLAATYDISALPSFAVFSSSAGSKPVKVVKGANIEAVRLALEEAISAVNQNSTGVAAASGSSGGDADGTLSFQLHELHKAVQASTASPFVVPEQHFAQLHAAVIKKAEDAKRPIGLVLASLLPFTEAAGSYLRCLMAKDEAACRAAVLGLGNALADSLTWKSFDDVQSMGTASGNFASSSSGGAAPTDSVTWLVARLHDLLRIETSREILCTSNRFLPTAVLNSETGQQFSHYSFFGAVCSIGVFPARSTHYDDIGATVQWFQSSNGRLVNPAAAEQQRERVAACVAHMTSVVKGLVYECLRYGTGSSRQQVLRWAGDFLRLNAGHGKEMSQDQQLCSRTAMAVLSNVLVQLAEPVVHDAAKLHTIPAEYVRCDAGGVVEWGRDEERVMQIDVLEALDASEQLDDESEQGPARTGSSPIGAAADGAKYAPKVHLFYLAFRSLTLAQSSALRRLAMWERDVRHPNVDERNRQYFVAQTEFHRVLVARKDVALRNLGFCEAVARWLVGVAKPDERTGALPETPPHAWGHIPQHFIDDTMLATALVTRERVEVEPAQLYGFVSLMLLLMGNTAYCPKPHTHAIFPEFLSAILSFPPFKDKVVGHPWFYDRIIVGCVRCYVVLEKCPYEKLVQRYYVARCLKEFLESEYYCQPAKRVLLDANNTELERFTHMLTSEANEALETALGNLEKMKRIEDNPAAAAAQQEQYQRRQQQGQLDRNAPNFSSANNNNNDQQEGGDEETPQENYHDLGNGLRQSLQLFEATIEVLVALADRFPEGVLRHMVAQQIAAMIIKSLAKLAGPKSKELKIRDPHKYGFKPRELLASVVTCLVKFRTNERFIRHALECGVAQSDIYFALDLILRQQLVPFSLTDGVSDVRQRLDKIQVFLQHEQEMWDDAPDYALCALLQEPLADPIAVPGTGDEEPMIVNREAMRHALLQEERNPMTRQPLTFKEVEEYNAKESVSSFVVRLKSKIEDWKEKKLKEMTKGSGEDDDDDDVIEIKKEDRGKK